MVRLGPQGPEGNVGPQGLAGADGAIGPQGEQGPQGAAGIQGPARPQGPLGPQGLQGLTGLQGLQGLPGAAGVDGAQGPAGTQGPAGPAGNNGAVGLDGVGIASARIEAGILILTLTDSTELNAGAVAEDPDAAMMIDFVPVGNPGNAPDPTTGFGAVADPFQIGKYEVTNAQYAVFLNAVAATDPNGLYASTMGTNARAGITQSGASGSYVYYVKRAMGDKPVNYVSFWDACRFCNWLHNGQPSGPQGATTTEDGAYPANLIRRSWH
jgi:hypothetical protein